MRNRKAKEPEVLGSRLELICAHCGRPLAEAWLLNDRLTVRGLGHSRVDRMQGAEEIEARARIRQLSEHAQRLVHAAEGAWTADLGSALEEVGSELRKTTEQLRALERTTGTYTLTCTAGHAPRIKAARLLEDLHRNDEIRRLRLA